MDKGILKTIDRPEVFTEPSVIKSKCGSLSTKNAILEVPYIVNELSPTVICVNTEGFKKNLREDEYVARAKYKIWLEGQKDLYKRKRDEYQRWIGRCKGINEFLEQRQQLDVITEEVFALMNALSDVITLIVHRTSKCPDYKKYRVSSVCDLISKTQLIMEAVVEMVKTVKTVGDHISIEQTKADVDGTYKIYSKICTHADNIRLDYRSLSRSWFSVKSMMRDDGLITDKDNEVKVVDSILPEEFVDSNFYIKDPMKRW